MDVSVSDTNRIREAINAEIKRPLSIAVFGQTGVGKSTLINSIFKTNLETSNSEPCTDTPNIVDVRSGDSTLRFIDLPGFGEKRDIDDDRLSLWKNHVESADVILVVSFSTSRSIDLEIDRVKKLVDKSKLGDVIFVCNQTDRLDVPEGWTYFLADDQIQVVPRQGIEDLIAAKSEYIQKRAKDSFSKDCTLVYCSALSGHGLLELCREIHSRIPKEASLGFGELIDPRKIGVIPRSEYRKFVPRVYFDSGKQKVIFNSKMFQ